MPYSHCISPPIRGNFMIYEKIFSIFRTNKREKMYLCSQKLTEDEEMDLR